MMSSRAIVWPVIRFREIAAQSAWPTSARLLVHMRERFPDRAMLRAQIWDSTVRNPQTVMPPFGKHKVLTEEEIDAIVDYIYQY